MQKKTFSAGEEKPLPFITAQMNCILHGLEAPDIRKGDTLAQKIADFTDKDRVEVILANPPFGAGVNKSDLANFTYPTNETANLFLEHFIAKLKAGGRAAIIIKNTFLSNDDNATKSLRKYLLSKCQLNWILDLPQKVFAAGVHTVVLFFTKGAKTEHPIHYYELDLGEVSLGKTRPLAESDLAEFEALATGQTLAAPSLATWTVDPQTLNPETCDLSVQNPNRVEEIPPTSAECIAKLHDLYQSIGHLLKDL